MIQSVDKKPLVSVLMTSYNRANLIAESIISVLNSTYENFELIIVDDCSTDLTYQIAREFAEKDERIKLYLNEFNLGDYANRNKAASYATGKYIKYLDADDIIYPNSLELMVMSMEKFPAASFGLSFSVVNEKQPYPILLSSKEIIRCEYLANSYLGVGPSASIIRTDDFHEIGGFSGKQFIGDTEFWLNIASKKSMLVFQPSLVWWREHPGQQIKLEGNNPAILITRFKLGLDHLLINQKYFNQSEYLFAVKKWKQHFSRYLLSNLFKNKDFKRFVFLFKSSGLSFFELLQGWKKYY